MFSLIYIRRGRRFTESRHFFRNSSSGEKMGVVGRTGLEPATFGS